MQFGLGTDVVGWIIIEIKIASRNYNICQYCCPQKDQRHNGLWKIWSEGSF